MTATQEAAQKIANLWIHLQKMVKCLPTVTRDEELARALESVNSRLRQHCFRANPRTKSTFDRLGKTSNNSMRRRGSFDSVAPSIALSAASAFSYARSADRSAYPVKPSLQVQEPKTAASSVARLGESASAITITAVATTAGKQSPVPASPSSPSRGTPSRGTIRDACRKCLKDTSLLPAEDRDNFQVVPFSSGCLRPRVWVDNFVLSSGGGLECDAKYRVFVRIPKPGSKVATAETPSKRTIQPQEVVDETPPPAQSEQHRAKGTGSDKSDDQPIRPSRKKRRRSLDVIEEVEARPERRKKARNKEETGTVSEDNAPVEKAQVPPPDDLNEEALYDVEELCDMMKDQNGGEWFLIKWLGYPEDESTWEPLENIAPIGDHHQSINRYRRIHSLKIAISHKLKENPNYKWQCRPQDSDIADSVKKFILQERKIQRAWAANPKIKPVTAAIGEERTMPFYKYAQLWHRNR